MVRVSAEPLPAGVAETVAGDVLAGLGITAVCGAPGPARGAVLAGVSARLKTAGLRVVVLAAGGSLAAPRPADPGAVRLRALLDEVLARSDMPELVLLVDEAESLSAEACRLMSVLLRLTRDGRARVRFVLFGHDAPWPELHRVRQNLWATYALPLLDESLPARERPGPAVVSWPRSRHSWRVGPAWAVAGLCVAIGCTAAAVLLEQSGMPGRQPPRLVSVPIPPTAAPPELPETRPGPQGVPPSSPDPLSPSNAGPVPNRGLMLVVRPGDTLRKLYSEVYRGQPMPPFSKVQAMNPAPLRPGTLVTFPEPPGGWLADGGRR